MCTLYAENYVIRIVQRYKLQLLAFVTMVGALTRHLSISELMLKVTISSGYLIAKINTC